MGWLRDKLYSPLLRFTLQNKLVTVSLFLVFVMLTLGSFQGGIIRGAFFPRVASDRIQVTLNMPNGTNEQVTDSIISFIEEKAWEVNKEFTEEYLEDSGKQLSENIIKNLGPGTAAASITINMLPGEERPDVLNADLVTNRLREKVGPIIGAESLVFGSGGNFGGRPVSVSLLGNNIAELKAVKKELKEVMVANQLLKDVTDNDPAGIKEIRISLKEQAYALGLNLSDVMGQVRAAFFGAQDAYRNAFRTTRSLK